MVSTYLDYNLIARDMKLSLRRVSEQTIVARDTQYYRRTSAVWPLSTSS